MAFLATADELSGTAAPSTTSLEALVRAAVSVKSVADATARAQAVTDWPTASGAAISAANPVIVYRQDTNAIEISEDGTTFVTFVSGDSDWTASTAAATYDDNSTVESRVISGVCHLKGLLRPDSGTIAAGSVSDVVTLATGHRPSSTRYISATGWVNGATPPYKGDAAVNIDSDGTISVSVARESTGVYVDGVSFPVA